MKYRHGKLLKFLLLPFVKSCHKYLSDFTDKSLVLIKVHTTPCSCVPQRELCTACVAGLRGCHQVKGGMVLMQKSLEPSIKPVAPK